MSREKLVGQRQIQKMAKISVNSVQNISDDDFFLETETSYDLVICSSNTSSSHVSAFSSDEPIIFSSISDNYAMDFAQTDCDAEILQKLSTNIVLTQTRMVEIFSDCIDSSCQNRIKN